MTTLRTHANEGDYGMREPAVKDFVRFLLIVVAFSAIVGLFGGSWWDALRAGLAGGTGTLIGKTASFFRRRLAIGLLLSALGLFVVLGAVGVVQLTYFSLLFALTALLGLWDGLRAQGRQGNG
jgi:hypothetical protein